MELYEVDATQAVAFTGQQWTPQFVPSPHVQVPYVLVSFQQM